MFSDPIFLVPLIFENKKQFLKIGVVVIFESHTKHIKYKRAGVSGN